MTGSSNQKGITAHLPPRAVVVTASLGGLRTLEAALAPVPREFSAPIVVAHHLADRARSYLVELLARRTALPVHWATHLARLRPGHVYIGPPGKHITVTAYGHCRLGNGPRYNFARPSGDLLFRSAAERLGPRVIGIVLSGRLSDGAAGASAIRAAGGVVIAQDSATCVAHDMPNAAIANGAAHFVLPPRAIGHALVSLAMVPGAAELFGVGVRTRAA